MKPKIKIDEWAAINSLIDLAEQSVADAEDEHCQKRHVSRRNGGYSQDVRRARKAMKKLFIIIQSEAS
jgi:hypothetical protein